LCLIDCAVVGFGCLRQGGDNFEMLNGISVLMMGSGFVLILGYEISGKIVIGCLCCSCPWRFSVLNFLAF